MNNQIQTVRDLVSFWASPVDLADALSTETDVVPVSRVFRWMRENRIMSKHYAGILMAAETRGINLSMDDLDRIRGDV